MQIHPLLKSGWTWFFVVLIVSIVFWPRGGSREQVVTGKTTVRDTVVTHDTIKTALSVPVIKKVIVHDTIKTADTIAPVIKVDSTVNYSIDQHYNRGAYVKADMSSKGFPAKRPLDFKGLITYLPPVDSIKIEFRTDTTKVFVSKPPTIPAWKIGALSFVAGVVATLLLKK
jgi:hypothetical protein